MIPIFDDRAKSFLKVFDGLANSSTGYESLSLVKSKKEVTLRKSNKEPLWYAEQDDNYINVVLNNFLTQKALRAIADKYYSSQIKEIIQQSSELTPDTYPTLFNIYNSCITKLGMEIRPKVYLTTRLRGANALSVETNGRKFILLGRKTPILLSSEELAFILGHELSHHQQGNLICHTVNGLLDSLNNTSKIFGPMSSGAIEVPMKRWCRQSEFNADRAGYLCCNDINVVKQLFLKVGMIEKPSAYHHYKETEEDHPMLITRYKKLIEFINKISI